jgi:hypothetical protein
MIQEITPYGLLHGFQKRGGRHFYGVKGGQCPSAMLGRGVFDLLREAKTEAAKHRASEIWVYDENGKGERTRAVCIHANFAEAEEYALHVSLPNVKTEPQARQNTL